MERKYEFTNYSIMYNDHLLHQIRAVRDFSGIEKGSRGGFIEAEFNLSHDGDCWVADNAFVYDNAIVKDNAYVCGNARIFFFACVRGNAVVEDNARVTGAAVVRDDAYVFENAFIEGNARIKGNSTVAGNAIITNNAIVRDNAMVSDNAEVSGFAQIYGYAHIQDYAIIKGGAEIGGTAVVCGQSIIAGYADIAGDAIIEDIEIKEDEEIIGGVIYKNSLEEQIRCQTGLVPINGEVIAYKIVNSDLSSLYDNNFKYKIEEWVEAEEAEESSKSCASGLHFANAVYWDTQFRLHYNNIHPVYLAAKIKLEDIITVQEGKIRCRKAFILGKYEP